MLKTKMQKATPEDNKVVCLSGLRKGGLSDLKGKF